MSLIDKIQQLISGAQERTKAPLPEPKAKGDHFITHEMMSRHRDLDEDYQELNDAVLKIDKLKKKIKAAKDVLQTQFMKALKEKLQVEPGPFALEMDTRKHRFSPPYKVWLEDAIGASSIEAKLTAHKLEHKIPEEDEFVKVIKLRQPVGSRVE